MSLNVAEILITAKDQTQSGFDSAKVGIENLHGKVTALAGALSGGMFAKMIVDSLDAADKIGKLAQSTGVSTEALSRMSVSAKLSDIDMEALAKSMGKLSKNIIDAADGTGTGKKAFDAMGISIKDASGHLKSNDQVMAEVSDRFAGMNDGAGKTALAMDIFGKSGAAMIPMLNGGSSALKENADLADKLGLTLSKSTASAAEAVNDRFATMGLAGKGIANTIMQQMLPTFDSLSKVMVDSATNTDNLKKISDGLDVTLRSLVTGGVIVKSVFSALGNVFGGVAAAIMLALQGDFSAAKNALSDMGDTMVSNMSGDMDSIAKVWENSTPKVTQAAQESAKKTFDGYGDAAKAAIKKSKDEQYSAAMAMLESELKTSGEYAKQHVKQLDAQLAAMQISEREFYSAKKEIALQDLATERGYLEAELALARSKNEKLKEIEIQGKLDRNKISQDEAGGATAYDNKANKASMSPLEIEKKAYTDRLNLAAHYRSMKGDEDGRAKAMEASAQEAHEASMQAIIERGGFSRSEFEKMTAKQQFLYYTGMLQQTLMASASHSRASFEVMKVAKLAEAAIALPSTVMAAYESGMKAGGPAGPAVGAAYAAIALASQLVQINAINSASFGGGASAGSAPSAGGVSSSAVPGQTANPNQVSAQAQVQQPVAQPVNVYISGNVMTEDFVANTVIPEIKNQITNADVTIIDPRSRQAQMLAVPA
jgi:hypothetical protein